MDVNSHHDVESLMSNQTQNLSRGVGVILPLSLFGQLSTMTARAAFLLMNTPSPRDLAMEKYFQEGRKDRMAGQPCKSANGAYLNGWYSPEKPTYYVTETPQDVSRGIQTPSEGQKPGKSGKAEGI